MDIRSFHVAEVYSYLRVSHLCLCLCEPNLSRFEPAPWTTLTRSFSKLYEPQGKPAWGAQDSKLSLAKLENLSWPFVRKCRSDSFELAGAKLFVLKNLGLK